MATEFEAGLVFKDTTGDHKFDTVMKDTTGDGKLVLFLLSPAPSLTYAQKDQSKSVPYLGMLVIIQP